MPGEWSPSFDDRARSTEYRTASAVTSAFDGGAKRTPERTSNVYVLPSAERRGGADARSGSRAPFGPLGRPMSIEHVPRSLMNVHQPEPSAGSGGSKV